MLKVINCLAFQHDPRLVALSALICVLGCYTMTTMMARAGETAGRRSQRWLALAAVVFGCSVWSLHFIAMLAFRPGLTMAYDVGLTALSVLVAPAGAMAALLVWQTATGRPARVAAAGLQLGLAVPGLASGGVAPARATELLSFDRTYLAASAIAGTVLSILALSRAGNLTTAGRRLETAGWLALGVVALHFTGVAAITVVPGHAEAPGATGLATAALSLAGGTIRATILIASLSADLLDQQITRWSARELRRMRLMSNLAQEVLIIHRDGIVLEVNSAGERLFKAAASDIIGRSILKLFTSDSEPALMRRERCEPFDRRSEEFDVQAVDGTRIAVELSCQPIDHLGKPATVIALRDLTDRRRHEERIRHLARHDALTSLPNRYALMEQLGFALNAAARQHTAAAVVYIDLDRFKPVNDLYGHAAGDALLVEASKRLLAEVRSSDTLTRIGGDEFVLILTDDAQPEKASAVATRIIDALRKPFHIEGHRIEIGASVGIALYPDDGSSADTLMRAADAAMYRAKAQGQGALRFFEASMNAQLQSQLQLEQELAGAVERDELILHYQPIVNGVTGEVETFEALIRWAHPRRGMVGPIEFIPLAEQTGLIDHIGRWVIETACREAAGWAQPWRVSLNVSPVQFRHSDLCDVIGAALQANALDPGRLVVEVTEGILINDASKAVATLNRLKEMGVRVALDDFGTGYSSLSYLQLFKFDKFKIDKSFVRKLGQDNDALTITRTIVNLGHNLGLQVTAEGVETQAQLALLQALGCDEIQGYLIARPAPIGSFTEVDRLRTTALFGKDRLRLLA